MVNGALGNLGVHVVCLVEEASAGGDEHVTTRLLLTLAMIAKDLPLKWMSVIQTIAQVCVFFD